MTLLTVLVTGAGGLIGSELCGALADRGHRVLALVHRRTRIVRSDGSTVPTEDGAPGGVAVLRGDIGRADLGLGPDAARVLAGCDLVVHCAAETGLAAGARHAAINVGGTQHLLNLLAAARTGPARTGLLHVSTAYVCGARSGRIGEDHGGEDHGGAVCNGYEASKVEGERRVLASGVPAAIARPSIVVGRWADGAISRFENIYGLLRLVGSGRIRALPAGPGATLDLVPIDHVVGGLVDIAERFEAARGRVFHLTSGDPVPVATLCGTAFTGFHAPRLVPARAFQGQGTARHELLSLYAGYLTRDPRFVAANLAALSGRVAPATDAAFLQRMVGYAAGAGFLRRDPALLLQVT